MALHHLHVRKRRSFPYLEPFPASRFWLRILDRIVLAAGILGPILTIPQILDIYLTHSAGSVSPISWGSYMLLNVPWIFYGLVHKERPIVVTYTLWFFTNAVVFTGTLLY